jgi:hypothetical protein
MKLNTNTSNPLFTACLLSTTLFFASCQDDDRGKKTPAVDDTQKKEHVEKVLDFRQELDFINRFVDKNVMGDAVAEGVRMFTPKSFGRVKEISPCTDVTEEELPDGAIKINLDFGDGCQTDEGVEVAGAVEMIFKFNENTLEYTLDFIDYKEGKGGQRPGELVNGTVKGNFTLNIQSGRYSQKMDQDLEITFSDNTTAYYRATQVAEMTGAGLHVTAFTTAGILASGDNFNTMLQEDVVYDFNCAGNLPTTGEEKVTLMGNTILVNYGNGTCDNVYSVD